jgi:hypothetical protein
MSLSGIKDVIQERDIEAKINRIIIRKMNAVCDYLHNTAIMVFVNTQIMYQFVYKVYIHTKLFDFMIGNMDVYGKLTNNISTISAVIVGAQFVLRRVVRVLKVRPTDIELEYGAYKYKPDDYERIE